jgi:hypothetical protein
VAFQTHVVTQLPDFLMLSLYAKVSLQ